MFNIDFGITIFAMIYLGRSFPTVLHSHVQVKPASVIARAFGSSANAFVIPETHHRSYGQPVFETHPYSIEKNEGNKQRISFLC
jgi:hypothetical protein